MIVKSGMLLKGGHYKLISRIAVGGMGEVWRAHDLLADSPVAIKLLRPEYTDDEVSLKRLRFEARNAAMLNHPNITRVFDHGEIDGTGFIVMEYVEGQSLADVLATHSTIAPLRLLPILIQAALGLQAAHDAGVVHRDIKPGNILLGPSDQVKLTDFGISIAPGQMPLTDTGKVMGTAQYLSPEQALGNPATPAGDLYALGVIAYEALVGERPFRGVNYVAIALAQVNEPPPPLPASVEKSLARLVLRLMEKDPAKRPADGAELAGLLGEILEIHRELASRLLATRRGGPASEPLRTGTTEPTDTADHVNLPASALKPAEAPLTAPAPVVAQLETDPGTVPALPADAPPRVYPPERQPRSRPTPRRRPASGQPELAVPLPEVPPVSASQPEGNGAVGLATPPPARVGGSEAGSSHQRPVPGPMLRQPVRRDAIPAPRAPQDSGPAPEVTPPPVSDAAPRSLQPTPVSSSPPLDQPIRRDQAPVASTEAPRRTQTARPVSSAAPLDRPVRRDEAAAPAGSTRPPRPVVRHPHRPNSASQPGESSQGTKPDGGTNQTPASPDQPDSVQRVSAGGVAGGTQPGDAANGLGEQAGPAASGTITGFDAATPPSGQAPDQRARRFSPGWWAPVIVALGLVVILLIGLLTLLSADNTPGATTPTETVRSLVASQDTIMLASNAPDLALFRER
ncbi:MAG: protein kinase [Bifidobacteriaceae bacterium]|jgi:serine/threonine-protein kinase|nr:protein kinase [Bifidobacteriaceae bacterium]